MVSRLMWGVSVAMILALVVLSLRAGNLVDPWLSPDQQAMRHYQAKDYAAAAGHFENPMWKGRAQYAAGQYEEAAGTFGQVPTAEGFFNTGNAWMRAFEYRKAISAYELAVAEAPGWQNAQDNLELARYTLDYIERSREESGTEGKLGADDVRYDNSSERGQEVEVSRETAVQAMSAEKWMRTVDTETAEFLRSRFALESDQEGAP